MTEDRFGELATLTETLYEAERAKLRDLNRQEMRLRHDLALLDAQRLSNQRVPEPDLRGFREIGGDLRWLGWVGRNRAALQTDLARVLARKGQMMQALRRAFGKHQAALILQATEQEKIRRRALSRQEHDLALLANLHRIKSP
jgi:hypothetical protein